jgi:NAD(P)-dependent dehydrogenase (short-subunit alcohol dehydrogenase family)
MQQLRGKVAVVTGAASGIGLAMCHRAAAEGMRVVMADVEEAPLELAASQLAAGGADVLAVVTDVSDGESVTRLRDRAAEHFGTVHLVHNNAGVSVGGTIWEVPEADWRWVIGVNLWGVVHGIRAFVPLLVQQGEGHVVNTASLAGLVSPPLIGPYNATKHAVVTISETLLKDLRLAGAPVGVSVLCPGFVRTAISDSDRNRPAWAPTHPEARVQELAHLGKQLTAGGIDPAEVAKTVFDAVRDDRFYVFTHPETKAAVAHRMHDLLDERTPDALPFA